MIGTRPEVDIFRMVRVAYVWPGAQTFDGVAMDTGDYIRSIQVLSPYAGTDFGFTGGIPSPESEGWEENKEIDPNKRDIVGIVINIKGRPVCLGFCYPQVTHLAFTKEADKNRLIERHTSDVYRSISDEGDMDIVHPSGAWIRIGKGEDPDDLTGRDFDHRWHLKHNKSNKISITIRNTSGDYNGKIVIDQDGNIEIKAQDHLRITAGETITILAKTIVNNAIQQIVEQTPVHTTTGVHTDSIGTHVP